MLERQRFALEREKQPDSQTHKNWLCVMRS